MPRGDYITDIQIHCGGGNRNQPRRPTYLEITTSNDLKVSDGQITADHTLYKHYGKRLLSFYGHASEDAIESLGVRFVDVHYGFWPGVEPFIPVPATHHGTEDYRSETSAHKGEKVGYQRLARQWNDAAYVSDGRHLRLSTVDLRCGRRLDQIRTGFSNALNPKDYRLADAHGGNGGLPVAQLRLAPFEWITTVVIDLVQVEGTDRVSYLEIRTSSNQVRTCGIKTGESIVKNRYIEEED